MRCSLGTLLDSYLAEIPLAANQGTAVIDAFTKRFPKVGLNLTVELSKYIDPRIDRSFFAQDECVDVAALHTFQDFTRWQSENHLLYYKPTSFSDIVNGGKEPNGSWLPLFTFSFGP